MKTEVIMQRPINGFDVRQNSKTLFFNANDLLDIYNKTTGQNKRIQNYLDNESTKDFLNSLAKAENQNNSNQSDLEYGLIETKRGKFGGTWVHPYLFIDFAMWLSSDFKVTVIRWVYDNLIKLRHEAGDTFKEVNEALFEAKPNTPPFEYANEAKMINRICFGSCNVGQRNLATEKQLDLLKRLQVADVKLIQKGKRYYEREQELYKFKELL